jgi:membrane-bound ClpP family serine protease
MRSVFVVRVGWRYMFKAVIEGAPPIAAWPLIGGIALSILFNNPGFLVLGVAGAVLVALFFLLDGMIRIVGKI